MRLGWAALQMQWLLAAHDRPITQITPPNEVLEFVDSHIGLTDMCVEHIHYLITYAPQLTVRGLAGPFEPIIETDYRRSIAWNEQRVSEGSSFGTATTREGQVPRFSEAFALRDPDFGGYESASVACAFVQGYGVANGPPVKYYSTIDDLAWLLSSESEWLGSRTREVLTEGMASWGAWVWDGNDCTAEELGYETDRDFAGKFGEVVSEAKSIDTLQITSEAHQDLFQRLDFSAKLLGLPEGADELVSRVTATEFLRHFYEHRDQ